MSQVDVIVIGAGAAGLMCAAQAGYRGRSVTVLDMGKKPGRKILISGGGRCNFTNENATPDNYLCANAHFVKSCLSRYTQHDFIELVDRHGLAYHHKTLGQLFCDNNAQDIVDILLTECEWAGVNIKLRSEVISVSKTETGYSVTTEQETLSCESLVIASGGLTMPKLGATPIGYKIAEQFGLSVLPTMAALVPFTLHQHDKERFEGLSGISIPCEVSSEDGTVFKENILFTHRGLSGPAILQISSFWRAGQAVTINLLPEIDLRQQLADWRETQAQKSLKNSLATILPKRFIEILHESKAIPDCNINQLTHAQINELVNYIHAWQIKPNGTEGYRTAEVTLGGVDTDELSSKTFEAKKAKGLYFIGEVTDVTGWLGGYNFQYAWSCGFACGQHA
ncbi:MULTISPECIES: NAD(P)/FAD-dependent oxidoreductase [Pseudoalteromonas]|jgi:predicted Rossmann fold flavoprotein|uniref:NAD(P)/FAD-dependent oxidoreductase n=1 Tax=Pseudoalteromonas TaxID=53246 RepID=UPI00041A9CA3|nr:MULTISPECIES: NAD(P)/FAD-dependent oxidoreductase [Pseudoalteromonas]MBB1275658.1 NAD(P)/FAD-dependent oxidoreductase [Pseudoalteromonas sp. SR43-3]MBB1279784.1 NAD(P)/FAD-dependent oxidoreductase [Pseudoalteromonas sp. SR41-1]MBB1328819.1 NAD(P)/FAD-dependent oxidoreductase [Pseudoalteromonas sp. SR43-7]MBB1337682.1 NAD(P)/FAD-dependent oxidoreductase [Pseudoalteromonas sp. SR44-2]MBB1353672.1 NAD(P)/FAD-dependent oxidoreductase [Pseudoalteromonas sp. SR45-5]|tara:strand:+ start:2823 stop:4007 length:1185 start_codon:yes stop_codon:yes gene_type:complete